MRNKIPLHIKAWKLDAIGVALDIFKQASRNSLGRLSQIIAREHPVNIGFIQRPETTADI